MNYFCHIYNYIITCFFATNLFCSQLSSSSQQTTCEMSSLIQKSISPTKVSFITVIKSKLFSSKIKPKIFNDQKHSIPQQITQSKKTPIIPAEDSDTVFSRIKPQSIKMELRVAPLQNESLVSWQQNMLTLQKSQNQNPLIFLSNLANLLEHFPSRYTAITVLDNPRNGSQHVRNSHGKNTYKLENSSCFTITLHKLSQVQSQLNNRVNYAWNLAGLNMLELPAIVSSHQDPNQDESVIRTKFKTENVVMVLQDLVKATQLLDTQVSSYKQALQQSLENLANASDNPTSHQLKKYKNELTDQLKEAHKAEAPIFTVKIKTK